MSGHLSIAKWPLVPQSKPEILAQGTDYCFEVIHKRDRFQDHF